MYVYFIFNMYKVLTGYIIWTELFEHSHMLKDKSDPPGGSPHLTHFSTPAWLLLLTHPVFLLPAILLIL